MAETAHAGRLQDHLERGASGRWRHSGTGVWARVVDNGVATVARRSNGLQRDLRPKRSVKSPFYGLSISQLGSGKRAKGNILLIRVAFSIQLEI